MGDQQPKCIHCYTTSNKQVNKHQVVKDDVIQEMKAFFEKFESDRESREKEVQAFTDRITHAHSMGLHLEAVSNPQKSCQLLTSLLPLSFYTPRLMSGVLRAVYKCVTLSRIYHRQFYETRRFWDILFDRIFGLPDQQFIEGIMVFLTVVCGAFTEETMHFSSGKYTIKVDRHLYLTGEFHPDKMFPIFKKLYELEGKIKLTSPAFDYKHVVCPLFAPAVAEKEWYSLKHKHPVDFIALLTHLSLSRPVLIDFLLLMDPGIPILMELLANKSCQRMHSSILFSIDALMSIETTDSRFELLRKLLDQLDYVILVKLAINDEVNYRRALAQKIILHTLRFLDIARKSGFVFARPKREQLIGVEFSKLTHMISKGGLDDKIFAFIITTERCEDGKEAIIREKFQDYAICVLKAFDKNFSGCRKESKDQLISCALNLLVAIGPLDEDECPSLFKNNTVEVFSKFYNYDEKDIKLLSRVNTVNICQTSFDKKLELFRLVPIASWGEEIYQLHRQRRSMNKNLYSQLMPVTVKLIHYDLCILYHMKKSGVLDELNGEKMRLVRKLKPDTFKNMDVFVNGENWTKMLDYNSKFDGLKKEICCVTQGVADKIMEVLVATVFDKAMPDRYNTIAVACMAHLMHTEELEVSHHITPNLFSAVDKMYDDEANRFYLSDGGDFMGALNKLHFSQLSLGDRSKPSCASYASTIAFEAQKKQHKVQHKSTPKPPLKAPASNKGGCGIRDKKLIEKLRDNVNNPTCVAKKKEDRYPPPSVSTPLTPKSEKRVISTPKSEKENKGGVLRDTMKKENKKEKKAKTCALPSCLRNKASALSQETRERKKFKKCGRCMHVTYCDKDCQATHWAAHKKVCKELPA